MKYPQLVSMPSAVSDWLEEQLEARGIDAIVYTRYVLSLLYRDPVDIICPDQDLHITNPNKEVKRSGGGRKRFRRSAEYWGQAYADADQLKRTAAVECLKSASDQKCGIESLVDELCEKLKEIKSDSTNPIIDSSNIISKTTESKKLSAQDSAKRYYAAFPPLSRNASTASPNIITLIPKWFGSPKKKRQNRSSSYEDKLHFKVESDNMKSRSTSNKRINYFTRNNKDLGYCRNMAKSIECPESMDQWNLYTFNNNNNSKNVQVRDFTEMIEQNAQNQSWSEYEENMNMYDDLPVDIRDLLDSPTPQDDSVEMMNMANMRETGNKQFLPCGTNIISSIWSNDAPMDDSTVYDNAYNSTVDDDNQLLDFKFSSISIDKSPNIWSNEINTAMENETNLFYENCSKPSIFDSISVLDLNWSLSKLQKWSDAEFSENDEVVKSLTKLNHNKEESLFMEVKPNPLRVFNSLNQVNSLDAKQKLDEESSVEDDKEDLLHSASSHFKPISEKIETRGQYVDGTTFVIPNSLDKVKFKRSDSGMMYLDAEPGSLKRYLEYKKVTPDAEFTLKFNINQNDKACQTEMAAASEPDFDKAAFEESDFYFPGDRDILVDECFLESDEPASKSSRPDSMMAEIFGKHETKCDQCNNNTIWNTNWSGGGRTFDENLRNIWSGGEVCMACLGLSGGGKPPTSQERILLREDITQDGEQLLSDLSSLQKSYMDELPVAAELTCNLTELIDKEWKQTIMEESVPLHSGSFSFATRLQEDCLLKMATIPTLRSVTL